MATTTYTNPTTGHRRVVAHNNPKPAPVTDWPVGTAIGPQQPTAPPVESLEEWVARTRLVSPSEQDGAPPFIDTSHEPTTHGRSPLTVATAQAHTSVTAKRHTTTPRLNVAITRSGIHLRYHHKAGQTNTAHLLTIGAVIVISTAAVVTTVVSLGPSTTGLGVVTLAGFGLCALLLAVAAVVQAITDRT